MHVLVANDFIVIRIELGAAVLNIYDRDVLIKTQPFIGDATIALFFTATSMRGDGGAGSIILLALGKLFVSK